MLLPKAFDVVQIPAEWTRPLRWRVLRPHHTLLDTVFEGDETAVHFGAMLREGAGAEEVEKVNYVVGVASVYRKCPPGEQRGWADDNISKLLSGDDAWQLRGMATDESVRGSGAGGALLEVCLRYVQQQSPRGIFWCNARENVSGFYERYGLQLCGGVYEVQSVGPHVFMWKAM